MGSPTIKPSANIAIVWGSTNAVNSGLNGLLIETLQLTPKNGAPIDIESGAGFAAVQVGLKDGFDERDQVVPGEDGDFRGGAERTLMRA